MGWKQYSTLTPYSTINYLLEAAGIQDINNEEAQEFGLQLWAEDDGSSIGSVQVYIFMLGYDYDNDKDIPLTSNIHQLNFINL